MAETNQISFRFKEVVEALLKQQNIHEGVWAIYVKFGIKAMNVGDNEDNLLPCAMVPVVELGLRRTDEAENNISVNAALVNPAPAQRRGTVKLLPAKSAKRKSSG